jgi:Ran-binding protein 3
MPVSPKEAHVSDTEGGERPLRERLRNATIKSAPQTATTQPEPDKARAKLQRKRSHEDVENLEDEPAHKSRQARTNKRSRENSPEDKVAEQSGKRKSSELERDDEPVAVDAPPYSAPSANATEADDLIRSDESPKTKRSRVDDTTSTDTTSQTTSDVLATTEPEGTATGEPAQQPKPTAKIPAGSGFANTSASSPFASLATAKSPSEQPQPATSAFASSAFGALAGSSTSAFGALGQSKTLSSFASPGSTPAPEDGVKPAPSAFGGLSSAASPFASAGSSAFGSGGSGFGSGASGFGKLNNGFGGGFGGLSGGSKLTSFASSGTPGVIGSSTKVGITAFGAPADDEEEQSGEDGEDDSGVKSPKLIVDEDKKDERFFEQDSKTESFSGYLNFSLLTPI